MLAMAPKYNDPNKLVTINSQIVLKVKKFLEIPHNSVDSGLLSSCIMMVALLPPTLRDPSRESHFKLHFSRCSPVIHNRSF